MKQIAISEIIAVKLMIVGLLLFAALWLFKFVWKNAPVRRNLKTGVDRLVPLIEGLLWLGFVLWCIRQLVHNDLWNSIGVLAVVLIVAVLLSWFVVRDYLAGLVLKSDGSMKINDWIKVKGIEGKVSQMGQRAMIIATNSGETVTIPYSAVSGEISIKPNPSEKLMSHTFEMKVSKHKDLESVVAYIRRAILNAPWASVKKSPEIKLTKDTPQAYQLEITLFSIRRIYFQKIKDYMKSAIALSDVELIQ